MKQVARELARHEREWTVVHAESALEAIALMADSKLTDTLCLVIADLELPDGSGLDVLLEVGERARWSARLLLHGRPMARGELKQARRLADGLLPTRWQQNQLAKLVERLMFGSPRNRSSRAPWTR